MKSIAIGGSSPSLFERDAITESEYGLRDAHASCSVCQREVPLSEAVVPEASDYVAYFCGLDCYERWHSEAERTLAAAVR